MSDAYGAPKKSAADRGKKPEDEVRKYLKAYDERTHRFDWHRNYDAHTAGGRFQRQTGDFEFYFPDAHGVIEVKQVDHAFRLPHKNYAEEKVAKVYKRMLAGGMAIVLVYHTPIDQWRVTTLTPFRERTGGSWDLSAWELYPTAKAALDSLRVFL